MSIEVHRSRRTYYAQYTTLLNVPTNRFDRLLGDPNWPIIAGAKFLGFEQLAGLQLEDCGQPPEDSKGAGPIGVSGTDLDDLFRRQAAGELRTEEMLAELQRLRAKEGATRDGRSPDQLRNVLVARSGVPVGVWEQSAQQILESLLPTEVGRPQRLTADGDRQGVLAQAHGMGLEEVMVLDDFPMIVAAYGYTRMEDGPRGPTRPGILSRLNPFPVDRDHAGRSPVFVDQVNADALVLRLEPHTVLGWLSRNGVQPALPSGSDRESAIKAYFVQLFADANLRETIAARDAAQRFVFGLLHTLSHLGVRQAALLSGLERTSLSEYLLPSALTSIIYCNHRFGATIGALTALFEQSLDEWLAAIRAAHRCVYDPVCFDAGANCHACTHLAETSCRYFNLNLSRAFLFGGQDSVVGNVAQGFLQASRSTP